MYTPNAPYQEAVQFPHLVAPERIRPVQGYPVPEESGFVTELGQAGGAGEPKPEAKNAQGLRTDPPIDTPDKFTQQTNNFGRDFKGLEHALVDIGEQSDAIDIPNTKLEEKAQGQCGP